MSDAEAAGFGSSVGQWPAFPDSAEALQRLQERFKLAVITNCDDDLFAQSERRLGVAFDYVITAQQAGSYKPDQANFLLAFERIEEPRDRILHVAQSLFHDHVPAKALGMTSVWIDRRQGRGGGASHGRGSAPGRALHEHGRVRRRRRARLAGPLHGRRRRALRAVGGRA